MSEHHHPTSSGRLRAATAGLLAAAVGLAAAELTTAITRAWRSPVESVAEVVIDRAPRPVTKFAIEQFGSNDKLALVVGILATLAVVGVVVGLASRRRAVAGPVAFAAFALIGALAALERTGAPWHAVVPALVAGVVGAATLRLLEGRPVLPDRARHATRAMAASVAGAVGRPDAIDAAGEDGDERRAPTEAHDGVDRRRFLVLSGALVAVAGLAAAGGRFLRERFSATESRDNLVLPAADEPLAPLDDRYGVDVDAMTPFRTSNADFYRIDTALTVPQVPVEGWQLDVTGMVDQPLSLSFDELCERGLVEADVTLTCVSNRVGGDLVDNARWLGVPLQRLLDEAGVDPAADQVVGRSVDGYTCGFPVEAVGDGRTCLVAVGMNGEPLPLEHGFPARLVTAGLYGYVSATKWLTEIELMTFDDFESYWEIGRAHV